MAGERERERDAMRSQATALGRGIDSHVTEAAKSPQTSESL